MKRLAVSERPLSAAMSRRRLLLGAGATLGLVAIGCGGDDDDESAPEQASPATTQSPQATSTPTDSATPAPATSTPEPAAPPSLATLQATWTQLQPGGGPPSQRRDHSLVADAEGSFAYLFGGRVNSRDELGDFWVYDVEGNGWTDGGSGPAARFGQSKAFDLASARMLLFGGEGSGFFSDVWAYDPAGGQWTELAPNGAGPDNRYGAGGAYDQANSNLLVSHGFTSRGRFDDSWAFNAGGESWLEISPASGERPLRRCLLRTVFDVGGNRMFLFGGQSNEVPFLGDLWAFDLGGGGWTQVDTPGPSPRQLYSMVLASEGEALLFGGRTEAGDNNELWLLDLATATWTQLTAEGEAPSPRRGHDATWLTSSNAMLLFGGQSGDDLNDLWRLDFA